MKISASPYIVLSNLNFYTEVMLIFIGTFIVYNIGMWIWGAIEIRRFQRALAQGFDEMRRDLSPDLPHKERVLLYKNKLMQKYNGEVKSVTIPPRFGLIWVDTNMFIIVLTLVTIIYGTFRIQNFFITPFIIMENLWLHLLALIAAMVIIPLVIYFVFIDKHLREKQIKHQCSEIFQETKLKIDLLSDQLAATRKVDGNLRPREEINGIPESESVLEYSKRIFDEINMHKQTMRVHKFIDLYMRMILRKTGSDPSLTNLVNAAHYIRSRNPNSRRNPRRILGWMVPQAVDEHDLYTSLMIKAINEEGYELIRKEGRVPNPEKDYQLKHNSDLREVAKALEKFYGKKGASYLLGSSAMEYY